MEPTKVEYTSAKAWIALLSLIITGVTASDIAPVSGNAQTIWSIFVIIVGALATWYVPNKVKTIDGEAV